ncbi:MAG: DMT family transporter [Helcococcus sp.]|nr:DMT family transporter [Helcococcus sp.]
MQKLLRNKWLAYAISILCMFLWGSAFPAIKLTYRELNIQGGDYFAMIFVAGIRFTIAGILVLMLMFIFDRKNVNQMIIKFPYLLKLGIIVTTLGYLFFYIGTGNTSGMKAAILTSSSTFLVVIFSHFFLDERFDLYKFIAIILGLLGVIIANFNKEFNWNFTLIGEGFMFINAALGAIGTIYVKKKSNSVSAFAQSSGQFLYGGILLMLIGYFMLKSSLVFTFNSVLLLLYGGILSATAFTLWYMVLKEYKASEIAFLRLFIPFFGTFLSAIILNEEITWGVIVGLLFVIIGIIILNKTRRKYVKGKLC